MTGERIGRIIWTVLPNGVESDQKENQYPKISVLVSPRLGKNEESLKLGDFEDFGFLDWPGKLSQLLNYNGGFKLNVASESFSEQKTFMLIPTNEPPRSDLWRAIFKKETDVIGYTFDRYEDKNIISFPVANILEYIKDQYVEVASISATELPELVLLSRKFENIAPGGCEGSLIPCAFDFQKAYKFFKRSKYWDEKTKPPIPDLDFHKMVSSLGEYPKILRLLGLAIDFKVVRVLQDGTIVFPNPGDIPENSIVWISNDLFTKSVDIPLKTCSILDSVNGTFFAALRPGQQNEMPLEKGLLKLNDSKFEIVQVDVDGAAIKILDFANNLGRSSWSMPKWNAALKDFTEPSSEPEEKRTGLPSLRSGGISVVRTGRAEELHEEFVKASNMNDAIFPNSIDPNQDDPEASLLFAEDLVRGYRIDVWDSKSNHWHSLCKRVGTYTFLSEEGDIEIPQIEDEGWTSQGVTENPSSSENAQNDIYVHESLFHWDGWSLCAPRPGKIIVSPENAAKQDDYTGIGATENPGERILPLKTKFTPVKGSLPRLRFDVEYRLRARAVDLAGNGLGLEDLNPEDFTLASPKITYKRFEPIASPILILPETNEDKSTSPSPPPGRSLERLVISTDFPIDLRWIAPPKVSQLFAETHMMFDASFGDNRENQKTAKRKLDYEICKREGTFDPQKVSDTVTYLPDPMATGATIQNFTGAIRSIPFYKNHKWPEAEPFLILFEEGNINDWSNKNEYSNDYKRVIRILRIRLPKAETARILISSAMASYGLLNKMGIRQWTIDKNKPIDDNSALRGKHWMLTPYKEVVLVHAVKKPLAEPLLLLLKKKEDFKTSIGQTYAELHGKVYLNGKSTGKVDLVAKWLESIDNPQESIPKVKALNNAIYMESHAFGVPINLEGNALELNSGYVYYFANEKLPDNLSSLSDDDLKSLIEKFLAEKRPYGTFLAGLPVEDLRKLDGKTEGLSLGEFASKDFVGPVMSPPRHDFGDTKYRQVEYTPIATTRFREYFNPQRNELESESASEIKSIEEQFTSSGAKIVVDIPNSARPPKPRALYVVPTFGWKEEKTQFEKKLPSGRIEKINAVNRFRSGGCLRIYLDRPWYASGEGELLGIVTPKYSPIPAPYPLEFQFKDWGQYDAINAERKYFSGYNKETKFTGKYSIINKGQLREILLDDDLTINNKIFTFGTPLKLAEGYELAIKSIDVAGNKAYLELTKDGRTVDTGVIQPGIENATLSDETYCYKVDLENNEKLVQIAVHFKNAFIGVDTYIAIVDGIWQISDSPTFRARTNPNCSNKFLRCISQIGMDPIHRTCGIIDPTQLDFEGCEVGSDLMLDELKNPKGNYSEQEKVSVAAYNVNWNGDRRLWYADIKIKPGSSYYPFIRLALVRYQPNSIFNDSDDARISRVSVADLVQIAPDRTATLIWDDEYRDILRVSVSGMAPRNNDGFDKAKGNLVYATIEKKNNRIKDENLCWSPIGDSIQLDSNEKNKAIDEPVTWSGEMKIDKQIQSNIGKSGEYRLVIQEKEILPAKDVTVLGRVRKTYYHRIVYADTFKL